MQGFLHSGLKAGIAARNAPGYVQTRLSLRFSLLYFTMFVAGLLLARFTPLAASKSVVSSVSALFASPFDGCDLARDVIRRILSRARPELILLAAIIFSGMTFFCTAAAETLLTLHALTFGLIGSGAMETVIREATPVTQANLVFFVYFFSQLVLAGILLAAAVDAVVFSYEYRDACRAGRSRRDAVSVAYILRVLSLTGSTVLLHAARTGLLQLLTV